MHGKHHIMQFTVNTHPELRFRQDGNCKINLTPHVRYIIGKLVSEAPIKLEVQIGYCVNVGRTKVL